MAMLFGFSSLSTLPSPPADFSFYDVHIAAYAGLGALTARATGKGLRNVSWRAVIGASLISSAYRVTDEYHQPYTPGRAFDVLDMAAAGIGCRLGASGGGARRRTRSLVG